MKYMGILLILNQRISTSWGGSETTHSSLKIGNEALGVGRTDTGAHNTPGRIVKHDARGIAMLMEVHADPNPQSDFVSFDGRAQVVEKSSRRRDHGGNENSEREGEAPDSDVKWLGKSILPRRVDQREPAEGLGKEKKTVREQNVVGVPFVCEQ